MNIPWGTALPDITLLPYLADCFGVTIDELMDYELKTLTYKERFVKFMVSNGILNFRDVQLKSGVHANYYLNSENFITNAQIAQIGEFFADCIRENNNIIRRCTLSSQRLILSTPYKTVYVPHEKRIRWVDRKPRYQEGEREGHEMAANKIAIAGKQCFLYENSDTNIFLIQAVGEHELDALDREAEWIKKLSNGTPFVLAAIVIEDWNSQLSPWKAPAVFGREGFGSGAAETLAFVREALLPTLEQTYGQGRRMDYYLGGYSLSGLFSLWASYQTDTFSGIAAVSPSVWFPGWDSYMTSRSPQAQKIYLSLGEKEEKTKNRIMSKVGDHIRRQYELLSKDGHVKACLLEWNPGNHFTDPEIRMAKGFAWLLDDII